LRRSTVSQEASDEATAFGNLISGTGNEDQIAPPTSGSFTLATLRGQERQQQIEMASEALASRLDAIRQRGNRIKKALPVNAVGKDLLDKLYSTKVKNVGSKVLFSPETINDLAPLQLLIAINYLVGSQDNGTKRLTDEVKKYTWGTGDKPFPSWIKYMKNVAYGLNRNEQDIRIPFASATLAEATPKYFIDLFNNIKTGAIPQLRRDIERSRVRFIEEEGRPLEAAEFEFLPEDAPIDQAPIPGAPGAARGGGSGRCGGRGGARH
jgi:hypothetical protein